MINQKWIDTFFHISKMISTHKQFLPGCRSVKWLRVNKQSACTVCEKKDWCTYCPELNLACCMRVNSQRPCKNGGYLHSLDATPKLLTPKPNVEAPSKINVTKIMREWRERTKPEWIESLGVSLGVSAAALVSLGCAWAACHKAWAWPMYDGFREPVGIRLRTMAGKKFAVTGSHQGLFIPETGTSKNLVVVEGPTDLAAALSIGLFAIGRPSCLGCEGFCNEFIRREGISRVIICADHDDPGQRGADKLQSALKVPSVIFTPFTKDLREFVRMGGTESLINSMVKDSVWNIPATR